MKLQVLRYSSQADSTAGILMDVTDPSSKVFLAYTVEDEFREIKQKHETRIPAGEYVIEYRREGGFHNKYLSRWGSDFHKGMLWIKDVPGFEWILIHTGNDHNSTSGCLITGNSAESNLIKPGGWVGHSGDNYRTTYPYISNALERGEKVTIEYIDYDTQKYPFDKNVLKTPDVKVSKKPNKKLTGWRPW